MSTFVYVDNSNVWIEGKHVAAVADGLAPDIRAAQRQKVTAPFSIDFGRLLQFAGGDRRHVVRAVLYGSRPPANDSVWRAAQACGFDTVVHDRNAANREKKVDTSLATDIVTDSYEHMSPGDEVVLVAGDSDYVPVAQKLAARALAFHVVFWSHAAGELKATATSFTSLDPYLDHLRRRSSLRSTGLAGY